LIKSQEWKTRPLLYEEVVSELYRIIDKMNIQPGEQLPSEHELVEQLGISRNVLREAFHVLEGRGIINSKQGKGRFLRELPRSDYVGKKYASLSKNLECCSLLEAYEVRQVLEVKAIELIVRNATDKDIEDLEEACAKLDERFSRTKLTTGEFDMHRLYAEKTGSCFMEQTMDIVLSSILDMMRSTFHEVLDTHTTEREIDSHRNIIKAIKKRDTTTAKRLMFKHIQETIDMLK
jgi:DNA-binding FadR family transcriptional regulator